MKGERRRAGSTPFPTSTRWTVSGLRVGGICFDCKCRVMEIDGGYGLTLAWCDCAFPEDHHKMEIL